MRLGPTIERKFHNRFTGDFLFDCQRERYRARLFLNRNVMRVLAYHQKRQAKAPAALPKKNQPDGVPVSKPDDVLSKPQVKDEITLAAGPKRHSLRNLRDQFPNDDAELVLELRNIRKKLNFTCKLPDDEERPRKRTKRDVLECDCHVAIWDNREGFVAVEPIVKRSQLCFVTSRDGPLNSRFVDIKMDEPFRIRAQELFVDVNARGGLKKALGNKYFLETKIVPRKSTEDWPPVPILSGSDVTTVKDMGKRTMANIDGMLVSSYTNLPHAPPSEVPLSVSFVQDGRTYKTKYGMEVLSIWTRTSTYEAHIKKEEEEIPSDLCPLDIMPEQIQPKRRSLTKMLDETKKPPIPGSKVQLCYFWDTASHKDIDPVFRSSSVQGFRCPACCTLTFRGLKALQFHLINNHQRYRFIVEGQEKDSLSNELLRVRIKVEFAEIVRQKASNHVSDEREMNWKAPKGPFDLDAYLDGDHTWAGIPPRKWGNVHASSSKGSSATPREVNQRKSGFLPAEDVPNLPRPQRRRHKVIVARTKDKIPFLRSVSHRQIRINESPLSETDDDIDKAWIQQKHCQTIEDEEPLTEDAKEFRKRWDLHLMSENFPHGRYISDSLVRFVRTNSRWLQRVQYQIELEELFGQLRTQGLLDDRVISGCWKLINDGGEPDTKDISTVNMRDVGSSQIAAPISPSIPDNNSCGVCYKHITKKRQAVVCGGQNCTTQGALYHKKCVGLEERTPAWICKQCSRAVHPEQR